MLTRLLAQAKPLGRGQTETLLIPVGEPAWTKRLPSWRGRNRASSMIISFKDQFASNISESAAVKLAPTGSALRPHTTRMPASNRQAPGSVSEEPNHTECAIQAIRYLPSLR